MSTHDVIINQLLKTNLGEELSALEGSDLKKIIFHNYFKTKTKESSLQLSYLGHQLLSTMFQSWTIKLNDEFKYNGNIATKLAKVCKMPFYIQTNKIDQRREHEIVLFEKELSVMLKLSDGDIEHILSMK